MNNRGNQTILRIQILQIRWTHSRHLHKEEKQSKRSKARVLNKNGEAPQCSCNIEECTNMESSLPKNHLEHATSASVQKAKANYSTCAKKIWLSHKEKPIFKDST